MRRTISTEIKTFMTKHRQGSTKSIPRGPISGSHWLRRWQEWLHQWDQTKLNFRLIWLDQSEWVTCWPWFKMSFKCGCKDGHIELFRTWKAHVNLTFSYVKLYLRQENKILQLLILSLVVMTLSWLLDSRPTAKRWWHSARNVWFGVWSCPSYCESL